MAVNLEGPSQQALSCGKPVYLVVLLHDAGIDGNELINVALDWAPNLPKAEFIAPNAPYPCAASKGRQWFDSPTPNAEQLRASVDVLNQHLDQLLDKHGLDDNQLVLVGYAQGALLALHAGLRRADSLAGIIAITGTLDGAAVPADEIRGKPPILLIHSDVQPRVPFEIIDRAAAALTAQNILVKTESRPGDYYGIDEDAVNLAGDFLHKVLVKQMRSPF